MTTLNKIETKKPVKILDITQHIYSNKLFEIGFLPGKEVEIIRKGPGGDPFYLRLDNNYLAISKELVSLVLVS